jgi:hypothetical protein
LALCFLLTQRGYFCRQELFCKANACGLIIAILYVDKIQANVWVAGNDCRIGRGRETEFWGRLIDSTAA